MTVKLAGSFQRSLPRVRMCGCTIVLELLLATLIVPLNQFHYEVLSDYFDFLANPLPFSPNRTHPFLSALINSSSVEL